MSNKDYHICLHKMEQEISSLKVIAQKYWFVNPEKCNDLKR